jgi:hypothetical protein
MFSWELAGGGEFQAGRLKKIAGVGGASRTAESQQPKTSN